MEQRLLPPQSTVAQDDYIQEMVLLSRKQVIPTIIVDSDLLIRFINEPARLLFDGYYDLTYKPFFNVFGRIFTRVEIKNFFYCIRSEEKGYSWFGNIMHRARLLKTLNTKVRVHPIFDASDVLVGYWVLFEDVTDQSIEAYKQMLGGILQASKLKDNETGLHAERLNFYCRNFTEYLLSLNSYPQITRDFIENISFLAAIHDVGKIGTPDYILQKQSRLSSIEWEIMKEHTINGALIVSSFPIPMAKEITLSHHERWDGKGYPFNLEGEMIPLSARIVSIADVYDALRMKRPYKEALSHEKTVQIIARGAGKQFDPSLVHHFQKIHTKFDIVWETLNTHE